MKTVTCVGVVRLFHLFLSLKKCTIARDCMMMHNYCNFRNFWSHFNFGNGSVVPKLNLKLPITISLRGLPPQQLHSAHSQCQVQFFERFHRLAWHLLCSYDTYCLPGKDHCSNPCHIAARVHYYWRVKSSAPKSYLLQMSDTVSYRKFSTTNI